MYAAAGYLIELQSGKTWEEFVREKIFKPLDMNSTVYSIGDMVKQPDCGVPLHRETGQHRSSTRSPTMRISRAWPLAARSSPTSRTYPTGSSL